MGPAIRTQIVRIANSQGIRIPKPLLEQSGIQTEVEIEVGGIRPASQSRIGWDQAFTLMAERGDDALVEDFGSTDWDQVEWDWSQAF
jgi:antitoxin MazE